MSTAFRSRRVLLIIAGVLTMAVLVVALLHSPPVRKRVLGLLTSRLAAAGYVLQADQIDYNLFTLTARLDGVKLAIPSAVQTPFLVANQITVSVPWSILTGRIALSSLEVVSPAVTLHRDASGRDNWTAGSGSGSPAGLVALPIGHLRIANLEVKWTDEGQAASVDGALSIELTTHGNTSSGPIAFTRPAVVQWRGHTMSVSETGQLSWNARDLIVDALTVQSAEGTVHVRGRIDAVIDSPRADVQLDASLNLAAVSPWLNLSRPLSGDAQVAAHVTNDGIDLTALKARVLDATIAGHGQASFSGAGSASLTWDGLDLDDVLQRVLASAPRTLPAARSAGSIDARWTGLGLDRVDLSARSRLTSARARQRPSDVPVDATLAFGLAAGRWNLTADPIDAAGARTTARLSGALNSRDLMRSTVGGTLQVRTTADDREWARALVRMGVLDSASVHGQASGNFVVAGTLGAPSIDGGVDATLVYLTLPPASIKVTASANPDRVRLSGIDASLAGLSARGDVQWSARTNALAGSLEGSVPLDDLSGLTPSVPQSLGLSGTVDFSAGVSGSTTQPRVALRATGDSLEVSGEKIDRVEADIHLAGSDVTVDRLAVEQQAGRLEARGTYNLAREAYTAHVTATDVPLHVPLGQVGAPEASASGRVNATFEGSGTLSAPGGHGQLTIEDACWRNADLGTASVTVALSGRTAAFEFAARDLALDGHGTAGLDAAGPVSISARWQPADLEAIARRLSIATPVSGSAALAVDWTATRDQIANGRGSLTLDRADLVVGSQPVRLAQPGRIEVDERAIRATPIVLATGTSTTIKIDGVLNGAEGSNRLTLALDGSLADAALLRPLVGPAAGSYLDSLGGTVHAELTATGTTTNPRVSGRVQISDGHVAIAAGNGLTGIDVDVRYDDGVAIVDRVAAAFQGATLSATGRVPNAVFLQQLPAVIQPYVGKGTGPASLSAEIRGITPSTLAPFVGADALADMKLQADASINLEADRAALDAVRGSVTLGRSEISIAGISLDQQVPTKLAIANGRVTVDTFRWGPETNQVVLQGGVTLAADPVLDLSARAAVDLRMLNSFVTTARTAGRANAEIRVGGTLREPSVDGFLRLAAAEARIADPRAVIGDIRGTITFAGNTIKVDSLTATINGGDAELSGSLRYRGLAPLDGSFTLTANDTPISIEGLRAEANTSLTWTIDASGPTLSGQVTVLRSAFRDRLSLSGQLLSALHGSSIPVGEPEGLSLLSRTRLNIRLVTDDDLVIDNNIARLTVSADLRAVGTISRPSLTGRATLGEGGMLFFNGVRYRLADQGSIDFANPLRIEPNLDLQAVTTVQGNEITLTLKGTPDTLQSTLTSDNPTLSQTDLVSLLLTGRPASENTLLAGGEQLVGLLTGGFLEAAGRAIGFDTARVERGNPDLRLDAGLVAAETDPGARLTMGKTFGSHLDVVFSQSLQESGGLTWIVGYKPRRGIDLRVVSLDGGDRLYTFSHDITFGAPVRQAAAAVRPELRISEVTITGAGADEPALRSRLRQNAGDRFSFFDWQDDRDRIEAFYRSRRQFEARVVARRSSTDTSVRLTYLVRPGLPTALVVDGFSISRSASDAIDLAWQRWVADEFLIDEATDIVRADLANAGFVLPSVTSVVEPATNVRRLRVTVVPGERARARRIEFSGNATQSSNRLLGVLVDRGLNRSIWTQPAPARDALVAFYRSLGYLSTAIQIDPVAMSGTTAVLLIHVDEGGVARVASVTVDGVHAMTAEEATRTLGLTTGEVFSDARLDAAQRALDAQYRVRGFQRVGIDTQARTGAPGESTLEVDVVVRVIEGPQQRLSEIVTTGVSRTNPDLVKSALRLDLGEPVNLTAWNQARQRLYQTGAFRSVDIQPQVIALPEPPAPAAQTPATAPAEEPVKALVTVQEWPPLRLLYGLEVIDSVNAAGDAARNDAPETTPPGARTFGLGLSGTLTARGLFGRGISAGLSGRYAPNSTASRMYLTAPTFFGRQIVSTAFLQQARDRYGSTLTTNEPEFQTNTTNFTFEQRVRPTRRLSISYLYTRERNHTRELNPDPLEPLPFDVEVTIARLASTIIMDARNDLIDPTQGWFHSSNVTYAPRSLGSDLRFLKYFVQQYYYHPVGRVVVASSVRLGLATAFEQTLTPDQRFFAGGGNSVRGYLEDVLSPRDAFGGAVGGNALFVFNQEVRFPLFKIFRGVGFFDAGRAFEHVSDLSIRDLAAGAGLGLRVQTPFVLLRIDGGVPLDSSFGVRRIRWFFSIGQMF
jgi:outer membrane protein assembly factor BamA/autotransporter translocation and assembly factor TamB